MGGVTKFYPCGCQPGSRYRKLNSIEQGLVPEFESRAGGEKLL